MRTRFVGGPLHGKLKDIPRETPYYDVAVPHDITIRWVDDPNFGGMPKYQSVTYERRKVAFGMFAGLNVMVLASMSEAQFMRAIADIVEGVV